MANGIIGHTESEYLMKKWLDEKYEKEKSMVVVKYKSLSHGVGFAPYFASEWAAGFDLRAAIPSEEGESYVIHSGKRVIVPTGLVLAIPRGFEGQVRPRSGLALKHGVTVLNAPGTIDADYRGEIMVILINHGFRSFTINRGDRIAQLVIAPVQTVTLQKAIELEETARGDGGFGSSGIN
jgi:dUTP pyrophosphatase